MSRSFLNLLLVLFILNITNGCNAQPWKQTNPSENKLNDQFEASIADFRKSEKVEGLAFAIFGKDTILWQKCLGKSTYGYPVNEKTLFSIQSISKNFTALAVMIAVQDSLLDLDRSISHYLPDFKVNSCFEADPENKITLRMLLSHTAGFTHEAPVGNNYDFISCSFEDHLKSISDTWLKFPVGTAYSYSNLGVDLAAKIVERQSRMEFESYLKLHIFDPLAMTLTTLDDKQLLANTNKTEGTIPSTSTKHYTIPLMGSGAVYTNLSDFIKYVQLQMNYGKINGLELIDKKSLYEMYTIRLYNYGLGTYIDKSDSMYYINHNGSGYGYSATFLWFPEYKIGSVMLCNKQCNTSTICESLLKNYITGMNLTRNDSVNTDLNKINAHYFADADKINNVKKVYCSHDTLYKADWEKYTGTYAMLFSGLDFKWYARLAFAFRYYPQKLTIVQEGQTLKIKSSLGESIMREYKTGLFFTNGGELINFNLAIPTYKNVKLKKLN